MINTGVIEDGPRILSGIEKSVLRDRARGADEQEIRYFLRYIRADFLRDELARRNEAAEKMILELREATRSIPSNMNYDDMTALINEVRDIVRSGGGNNGD